MSEDATGCLAGLPPLAAGASCACEATEAALGALRETIAGLEAQLAQAEQERRFMHRILDELPAAISFTSKDLVLKLVNREWAARYGKRPKDFIGKHVTEAFQADVVHQFAAQLAQLLERGEPLVAVGLPVTLDVDGRPTTTYRDVSALPLRDEHGAIEGSLSLSFDATPRVVLEQALSERTAETERQRAMLASVIAHAPAGIAYLDRDLVVRWVNPAYARLTHRTAEQVCDLPLFEGVAPEARARFEPPLRGVLTTGEPFAAQAMPHAMPVDGETRETYWDVTYVPVHGPDRAIEGLMIFALEVSERIERERLQGERIAGLEEGDRLKDQFLSILSHELRTPLNGIMAFASVLDDEVVGPLTPEQHDYLRRILGGTEVLLSLINDLLDMSRIQAGKFALAPAPMAFAGVAHAVLENLAHAAERKGQRLVVEFPAGLPHVHADAQRVTQVLTNLVYNAVKFTPAGGTIVVHAVEAGPDLRCEVRDDGVGIAPADLGRIFRPFVQLDASATRSASGTGLGLAISAALVEAHGGRIGVDSTPGAGSTFWFTLPLSPEGPH